MIHLNHASQAVLPEGSRKAAEAVYRHYAAAGSLPIDRWKQIAETARSRAAMVAKVMPADVAFIASTTHGVHCAMHLVPFAPGDRVVVAGAFPTIVAPWMYGALSHVTPVFIPWTEPQAVVDGIQSACADGPVRAVFVDWVHYASGRVLPLERLRDLLPRDAYVVVDVMQGLGVLPSPAPHVDIMVAGGAKWLLGPEGTGILYLRPDRTWKMGLVGWLSAEYDDFTQCMPPRPPSSGARRLESGTRNTPGIAALSESLNMILTTHDPWGKVKPLVRRLIEGARELGLATSVREPESGIVGVECPHPDRVAALLLERGVRVSARERWVRISPHIVNTMDEIEAALAAMKDATRRLATAP